MSGGRRPKWRKSGEAPKGRTAFAESEGLEPRREQAKHDNYQRPRLERAFPSRGLASERDRKLPSPAGGAAYGRPRPRAQRSGSRLERRSSGMSELSQYGAPKSWSIALGRGGARKRNGEAPKGISHGVDFAPTKRGIWSLLRRGAIKALTGG